VLGIRFGARAPIHLSPARDPVGAVPALAVG